MPVSVDVEYPGSNEIVIDPFFLESGTGFVSVKGVGNRVVIGRPMAVGAAHFIAEHGASIVIGDQCVLGSLCVYGLAAGAKISVGRHCAFNSTVHVAAHEKATITIGSHCLFAPETSVMASDVHKIYAAKSSKRLNPAGDISIGDRVWVGARAVIFRNSTIGSDCVVGWGSVVKGRFPSNVALAGAPARVVKKGIRWEP